MRPSSAGAAIGGARPTALQESSVRCRPAEATPAESARTEPPSAGATTPSVRHRHRLAASAPSRLATGTRAGFAWTTASSAGDTTPSSGQQECEVPRTRVVPIPAGAASTAYHDMSPQGSRCPDGPRRHPAPSGWRFCSWTSRTRPRATPPTTKPGRASSLQSAISEASYGALDMEFVPLHRWLRSEHEHTHYLAENRQSLGDTRLRDFDSEAARLADPYVDFSEYDILMTVLPSQHFSGGTAIGSVETDEGVVASTVRINALSPLIRFNRVDRSRRLGLGRGPRVAAHSGPSGPVSHWIGGRAHRSASRQAAPPGLVRESWAWGRTSC